MSPKAQSEVLTQLLKCIPHSRRTCATAGDLGSASERGAQEEAQFCQKRSKGAFRALLVAIFPGPVHLSVPGGRDDQVIIKTRILCYQCEGHGHRATPVWLSKHWLQSISNFWGAFAIRLRWSGAGRSDRRILL